MTYQLNEKSAALRKQGEQTASAAGAKYFLAGRLYEEDRPLEGLRAEGLEALDQVVQSHTANIAADLPNAPWREDFMAAYLPAAKEVFGREPHLLVRANLTPDHDEEREFQLKKYEQGSQAVAAGMQAGLDAVGDQIKPQHRKEIEDARDGKVGFSAEELIDEKLKIERRIARDLALTLLEQCGIRALSVDDGQNSDAVHEHSLRQLTHNLRAFMPPEWIEAMNFGDPADVALTGRLGLAAIEKDPGTSVDSIHNIGGNVPVVSVSGRPTINHEREMEKAYRKEKNSVALETAGCRRAHWILLFTFIHPATCEYYCDSLRQTIRRAMTEGRPYTEEQADETEQSFDRFFAREFCEEAA